MKKSIIFPILLLPYLKPPGINYIAPWLENIFDVWKLLSIFAVIVIYLCKKQISPIILTISIYEFVRFFSTFVNSGDYLKILIECASVITFSMLIEVALKWDALYFLRTIVFLLTLICIINLITVLAFPDGLYSTTFERNWLLGYDNSHITFILPLAIFYMLYAYCKKYGLFRKFLYLAIIFSSIFITWSATSVVGISLFSLLCLLSEMNIRPRWINLKTCIIFAGVLFALLVILRAEDSLSYLIVDILGKNLTLTGRTFIWNKGFEAFLKNPILGCGVLDTSSIRLLLGGASHCHNMFLNILFESGLLGMFCFVVILFMIFKPLKQAHDNQYRFLIYIAFLCYFVIFQAEAYNLMFFFSICTISYNLPIVISQMENKRCVKKTVKFKFGNKISLRKEKA